MKTLILLFVICLSLSYCSKTRLLEKLRLLATECSGHGYLFKGQCFCQGQYSGANCEKSGGQFNYENPDDKCDDLLSRLDNLLNISPDYYEGEDDEFPRLTGNSIGEGDAAYGDKGSAWIKMHSISGENNFKIFKSFEATDVKQGALGNCYLLAAFASLLRIRNGEVIRNAFITQTDNSKRVYITRWLVDGKPRYVAVDDWIPGERGRASFSQVTEDNEFWAIILEKAWAKIHGTYMTTEGGFHTNVWKSLSQAPVYYKTHSEANFTPDSVWDFIKKLFDSDFAVGASTDKGNVNEVENHAYGVLDAVTVKTADGQIHKLIKMYNPWNKEVWQANPWGDDSDVWTPDVKKQVNYVRKDDGQYYVSASDFLANWVETAWAEVQKGYEIEYQDIAFIQKLDNYAIYDTKFQVSNNGRKTLYIMVDTQDWRLQMECGQAWTINNLKITGPDGKVYQSNQALEDDGITIKIENAVDGIYTVSASVWRMKDYALYFTITTYAQQGAIKFIPRPNNDIKYSNNKQCPNNCNGNGRCNIFKGTCHCFYPNKGSDCQGNTPNPNPAPTPVSKCQGKTCSSNGRCDETTGYCACYAGYSGINCEKKNVDPTPVDKCGGKTCSYNGVCDSTSGSCQCYQGYSGMNCEIKKVDPINKCQGKTCSYNGICDSNSGSCQCYQGYSGLNCENIQPVNKCTGKTCSYNGRCDEKTGYCACYAGYSGNNCEYNQPVPSPTCKDVAGVDCRPYISAGYCATARSSMEYYCPFSCKYC